ncbi:MAG: hypothetical protein M3R24_04050 [Chloroflexota bacterium]|nr:hypothetical protein [Chloroflexota bacterium]
MSEISSNLQAGITAARAGNLADARSWFIRVLQQEPRNETAWFWLSRVMPDTEQALRCVDHLLMINPRNPQAREARDVLAIRLLLEESAVLKSELAVPSTPERRYLLGEALVEARIITQQQLERALAEQAKLAKAQQHLRLGEILLRLKLIQPEQLEAAIATQIETGPAANVGATGQIGDFLIKQKLITRAQLHQALAKQAEWKRCGQPTLLGQVLVNCGYIMQDALNQALFEWQQEYSLAFR